MALLGYKYSRSSILGSFIFTNYRHSDDKFRDPVIETSSQMIGCGFGELQPIIENFKPSVTGEVLGENWRSYRRGCGRRFASAFDAVLAVPLAVQSNCYNFDIGSDGDFFCPWLNATSGGIHCVA